MSNTSPGPDFFIEREKLGKIAFESWALSLSATDLVAGIKRHGLDPTKKSHKWKTLKNLQQLMLSRIEEKRQRGAAFLQAVETICPTGIDYSSAWKYGAQPMTTTSYGILICADGAEVPLSSQDQDRLEAGEALTIDGHAVEFRKLDELPPAITRTVGQQWRYDWFVDGARVASIYE